jgi:hypothetical protein
MQQTHLFIQINYPRVYSFTKNMVLQTGGASMAYQPSQEEQMSALLYMYSNMDAMDQYFA